MASSALIAKKLWDVSYVLCAHRRWVKQAEQKMAKDGLKALHHLPCIVTVGRTTWRFEGPDDGQETVNPTPVLKVDDLVIAKSAVMQGLGIGYLPTELLDDTMKGVRALDLGPWQLPHRTVYAVYPASRHLSPKVQRLVDYVSQRWHAQTQKPSR